jgi:hypothetical protein
MSTFDPATIRQAVADFTPRRPQKFQDLLPAKDVIAELRQKRASYRAIADLLTKHCLPTSKTAVAVFCHEVLSEVVRPYRRPGRRRTATPTVSAGDAAVPAELESPADPKAAPPTRTRGPRIAQVRMLTPETK